MVTFLCHPMAEEIFRGTGVKISSEGERHMSVVIGSKAFKEIYVKTKVEKWINDVEELAEIRKTNPRWFMLPLQKQLVIDGLMFNERYPELMIILSLLKRQ